MSAPGIGALGYRLRTRLVRGLRSRSSAKRYAARQALQIQALRLRRLEIYAAFLGGRSVAQIVREQESWDQAAVEEAIRTRGGTA